MRRENIILGRDCVYSTDSSKTELNNNIIICGGSGSGKTMSYSEMRLIETKYSSLIMSVTKRRIVKKYMPLLKRRGYDVLDLNYINVAESNCGYDLLAYVKSYSDISYLARSIVMADPKKETANADPFWDEAAVSLLSAEIAYVKMNSAGGTFADVIKLNNRLYIKDGGDSIYTSLDDEFDLLESQNPGCFAASCWRTFRCLPIKTAGCVFSALNTVLDTIFTPDVCKMISEKKTIDFKKLANEKTVLFISTSAVNPALHSLVNIFYSQAFKELFEYAEKRSCGTLPLPVHFLCDDFATGGRVQNFSDYISIFREKDISVSILLQSETQLEQMYGADNTANIINNCDTYMYMGGMDLRTAQHMSLRLNAPLDEVLYMPIGQEIIFRRGQKPVLTERYNITDNLTYRAITEAYNKKLSVKEAI